MLEEVTQESRSNKKPVTQTGFKHRSSAKALSALLQSPRKHDELTHPIGSRDGNPRLARHAHDTSIRDVGKRYDRCVVGALRRVHRRERGGGAARWRQDALRWQGRSASPIVDALGFCEDHSAALLRQSDSHVLAHILGDATECILGWLADEKRYADRMLEVFFDIGRACPTCKLQSHRVTHQVR